MDTALDVGSRERATQPARPLDDAIERACARIAPSWPLDRFIAVNPFWGMIDRPIADVAAELRALSGARLLMPRSYYREAWLEGRLTEAHLREAIARRGAQTTPARLIALLDRESPTVATCARVMDVVDAHRDLVREVSWRELVTSSISKSCAAFFDGGQASLEPPREGGLYASWRRRALVDREPSLLMGLDSYPDVVRELPSSGREMAERALRDLDVPDEARERYLAALLLDVNGWASWCMYRRWTARLEGRDDDSVADLLAIRLAWEWMLHRTGGPGVALRWRHALSSWAELDERARAAERQDWLLQEALEIAWQRPVIEALPTGLATEAPADAAVQAVFCIDVRSEVLRRALEAQTSAVQTLGFAGFFGLPIEHQPIGSVHATPRLPGLLAPRLRTVDTGADERAAARRRARLDVAGAWKAFKTGGVSSFTFVEAMGLSYAWRLFADSFGINTPRSARTFGLDSDVESHVKPRLRGHIDGEALDVDARRDLAAGILRAMTLTRGFARLVLLTGHGSSSRNNPHAAGLDCGACCGQSGEVNARAAAALLNEPAVRAGLIEREIRVPDTTRFIAGLHHTTTDEVTLFDLDELPPTHAGDVERLRAWLADAGASARRERAPRLGVTEEDPERLRRAFRARAQDWGQVRPEWGLTNNAAFIVAPREHCKHLNLEGRSFLQEYRHQEDDGFAVLEQIMTAPMIVTHWINLQYYASTVDNVRYGSGNKVLHDVVGGHIGVFEGNGGDLRIGLPLQSVHDGRRFVHTPLRLSVFIEAPRAAIEAIVKKHATVRALVTNGWIALFQIDAGEKAVHAWRDDRWVREDQG